MVVVLVMVARAATPAVAAGAMFRANVWAANMGWHCSSANAPVPLERGVLTLTIVQSDAVLKQ